MSPRRLEEPLRPSSTQKPPSRLSTPSPDVSSWAPITQPLNATPYICPHPSSAYWFLCLPALLSPTHPTDQSSAPCMAPKNLLCSPLPWSQFLRSPHHPTTLYTNTAPVYFPVFTCPTLSVHVTMPTVISQSAHVDPLFLKCSSSSTVSFKFHFILQDPSQMPLS